MSEFANCMYKLRAEGKPYPRTCAECGLFGPCKAGLRPEREAAAASARPLPPSMPENEQRLTVLLANALGSRHPAMDDLARLIFDARKGRAASVRMLTGEERRDVARSMDSAHTTWLLSDWPCARLFSSAVIRKFCEVNGLGIVPLAPQDTGEK